MPSSPLLVSALALLLAFGIRRAAFLGAAGELAWLSKHRWDITCLLTCQRCFAAPFNLRLWNFPCSFCLPLAAPFPRSG